MIPRATYRLQFHKDFTFADTAKQADYFADLGISHIYASPILMARAGSRHGYDVVDHSRINPELGGEEGFRTMAAALRARGLGIIVDIVPNHMAVGKADNRWWLDLLSKGRQSRYADAFDIDWDTPGLEDKVLAPFLDGDPEALLAKGDLKLTRSPLGWNFSYFEHRFPLRPEDQAALGNADPDSLQRERIMSLLANQHFVLADWRDADSRVNWRRFFDITELAALRIAEPAVFEAVHDKIFMLYGEGLIDGVRVDHIDGLADPQAYCRALRARLSALGRPPYLVVEKILAVDEELSPAWGCDGTTGYDFMNEVSALQQADDGGTLERIWQQYGNRSRDFETEETEARREILTSRFAAQLKSCARATQRVLPDVPLPALREAIVEIIVWLRCYRDYTTGAADSPPPGPYFPAAAKHASEHVPRLAGIITRLADLFALRTQEDAVMDALRRFHQLSAPVAAKAVEDTAFYRYGRLLSRNDVGFDPRVTAMTVPQFHARMCRRAASLPNAMLATATHDHKRGEDCRARLAVLSEAAESWRDFLETVDMPDGLDSGDVYQLLQTLIGIWPLDGDPDEFFASRVTGWCEKFLREAKLRSNWIAPAAAYERKLQDYARHLTLSPGSAPFRMRLGILLGDIAAAAAANALVQAVLRYTQPGMPDLYQGCEFGDFSLVDPDNRRPVDFAARRAGLARTKGVGQAFDTDKQHIIAALLRARRGEPDFWCLACYRPIATGPDMLAFERSHGQSRVMVLARRQIFRNPQPRGEWDIQRNCVDLLTQRPFSVGKQDFVKLFESCPAVVLRDV